MLEDEINKDCYYKQYPDNDFSKYSSYGLNFEGKKKYILSPRNDKYLRSLRLNEDLEELLKKSNEEKKERQKKYEAFDRYNEERLIKLYSSKNTLETEGNKYKPNVFKSQQSIYNSNIINKLSNKILDESNIEKDNKEKLIKSVKKEKNRLNILTKYHNKEKSFNNNISKNTRFKHKYNIKSIKNIKPKQSIILPIINPRKIIIDTQLFNDSGIEDKDKSIGSNSQCMGKRYNPNNYDVKPINRVKRNYYGALYLH